MTSFMGCTHAAQAETETPADGVAADRHHNQHRGANVKLRAGSQALGAVTTTILTTSW